MRRAKGEGSVTRRKDGRWQARYQVNSKRKYVYGKTRREVARKLTEALSEVNKGLVYDDKGITLAKHLEGWLGSSRSSVRISTWERYEQICRKQIIPEIGHQKLKNLSPPRSRTSTGRSSRAFLPERSSTSTSPCAGAFPRPSSGTSCPRTLPGWWTPRGSPRRRCGPLPRRR